MTISRDAKVVEGFTLYGTETATSVGILYFGRPARYRSLMTSHITTDALDAYYINITNIQQLYTI